MDTLFPTSDGSFSLVHSEHGETYHSKFGARAEAIELYIKASGFADTVNRSELTQLAILDVGLGLGYNALATIQTWLDASNPGNIHMHSLEIDAALVSELASGKASWQQGWNNEWLELSRKMAKCSDKLWQMEHTHSSGAKLCWLISIGDATLNALPRCELGWDFVWQDAFSPKHSPELWTATWFSQIRERVSAKSILATYSVSRLVRDNLEAAGWEVSKIPTTTDKRHWLLAKPKLQQ